MQDGLAVTRTTWEDKVSVSMQGRFINTGDKGLAFGMRQVPLEVLEGRKIVQGVGECFECSYILNGQKRIGFFDPTDIRFSWMA